MPEGRDQHAIDRLRIGSLARVDRGGAAGPAGEQDEEELLHFLNEKDYIFEAALFTQDISMAMRIAKDMASMTLVINNHTAFRVDQMPFGGHKTAGLGMGGVKYAIEELTRIKQIIIKY
jgi:acyl-CoA reductase-like NAD-dependent aldehyde dehydrogenase